MSQCGRTDCAVSFLPEIRFSVQELTAHKWAQSLAKCHKVVAKLIAMLSQSGRKVYRKVCRKVVAKCLARFAQVYVTLLPKSGVAPANQRKGQNEKFI